MLSKRWLCAAVFVLLTASAGIVTAQLSPDEELGKYLFFDTNLSTPPGQSCAACHDPAVGYTGPDSNINAHGAVYPGAANTISDPRFGNRKPPSAAYAGDSPILALVKGTWTGGMFWDGRATGWRLGDPLAEQALGPFLNPLEQNLASSDDVVSKVEASSYSGLFTQICGDNTVFVSDRYDCIGRAIAAYERSNEVTKFTSEFDKEILSPLENKGLGLFRGKGKCDRCHTSTGKKALFTDFTYDNLGVPKNPDNPFYNMPSEYNPDGVNWIDLGLGGFLKIKAEEGKMKVPTLRNVAKGSCEVEPDNPECIIKAYAHNGYFKSLKSIVHFYNTRDVPEAGWPAPEVSQNMNTKELGNLGLTSAEEDAIVAFLGTLSDK